MIVADTSGLLALFDDSEDDHDAVVAALTTEPMDLVVSPFVVAELDYLVLSRVGVTAELAVLRELAGTGYELATLDAEQLAEATDVVARYADQRIGVTDASIVVLAGRYRTNRVLTLDHRHFDVLRDGQGRPFALLP